MVRLLTLDIQIILKIIYYLGYFSLFLFDGLEAVFFLYPTRSTHIKFKDTGSKKYWLLPFKNV